MSELKTELLAAIEEECRQLRNEVTNICADAVENASLPGFLLQETQDFQSGYICAQSQFAQMLRGMAEGEFADPDQEASK